jgi:putative oxidoreductase
MMRKLIQLAFLPLNQDWALLLLRVWLGVSLFVVHGYEKLVTFSQMAQCFPDPLHIGQTPSLVLALLADAVCSLLIIFGILTRLSSLFVVCSIGVAYVIVWHASLLNIRGEVAYLYLGGYAVLMLAGPGKYSLDYRLGLLTAACITT